MINIWKAPEGVEKETFYTETVETFGNKAGLNNDEKEVLRAVIEGVDSSSPAVTSKGISKYLDEKISVLLKVKKAVRRYGG